jgi:hypothetical protein
MWYPVWTCVSIRQESKFKYHGPDVSQPRSGRACNLYGNCRFGFNRPNSCPSWSRHAHCRYGNYVLKNCRPNIHPSWSGREKPYMEVTCNEDTTVRTMCHLIQTRLLNRKDFPAKFLKNLVAQLSVRTAHVHRPDGVQVYFA